jgi:methyl-accepting chemotaxis protein
MLSRIKIVTKLLGGFAMLVALAAAIGIVGILYAGIINDRLNDISTGTAPTIQSADDIVANNWQSNKVAEEVFSSTSPDDTKQLSDELSQLDPKFKESIKAVRAVNNDPAIEDALKKVETLRAQFWDHTQTLIATVLEGMQNQKDRDQKMAELDSFGDDVAKALGDVITFIHAEIDSAKAQAGQQDAAGVDVSKQLSDITDVLYPMLNASMDLQRMVVDLESTSRAHLADDNADTLPKIEASFKDMVASTTPHLEMLRKSVRTDELGQKIDVVEAQVKKYADMVLAPGGLFDTHTAGMANAEKAQGVLTALEKDAQDIADTLEVATRRGDELSDVADSAAEGAVVNAKSMILAMLGIAAVAALGLILIVIYNVVRPINAMTGTMGKLAGGDLTVEVAGAARKDELGAMAKAVQVFKEAGLENRRLVEEQKRQEEEQKRQMEAQRVKLETDLSNELGTLVNAAVVGDFSKRIDIAGKSGFIAKLGENLNRLVGTVGSALTEVLTMMGSMAQGDLSKRIGGTYEGQFQKLKDDANLTAEKLAEIVGQTVEGMANIKASTTEIATGATDLSSRTEEQVASLEEIAASIRQLNTTVQQSAENTGQASQLAIAARTSAEAGGEVASAAVKAMAEIEQSSQKISEIVGMIDEIAFQTNLLALNAAVEAARAGEAGRGFAVVAGEVRTLAQRSSQASKEIKTLISNSNTQVKQGVELVNKAGGTLGEIVTAVKRVSDIVSEIAAANKEQSASVGEVQEAIGQIEQATQQNAALVEETTAALGSADNQVQGVTEVISFFGASAVMTAVAPAKGAKAVQAKLAAKVARPAVNPTKSSGAKKAATGTGDGWEEF